MMNKQPEQEPRTSEEKLARMKSELAYMRKAQPEQEPVAWMNPHGGVSLRLFTGLEKNLYTIPLYTAPPQRKPLTDEQIYAIKHNWITLPFATHLDFARAIEAAHGIINEKIT